ncbi:MAG: hypothetical protein EBZ72_05970, partial [Burkholderiaceae bacterium]|nr:hypothetical protein [Burkholderiaceae bacterium]
TSSLLSFGDDSAQLLHRRAARIDRHPAGILDLTKTPEDSPLYKMAVSADAFIKASKAWQINVTDIASLTELAYCHPSWHSLALP